MAMNFDSMLKMKKAWDTFTANHPKFPMFLRALKSTGIKEGTVIAVTITDPDGKVMETNVKVTESDLELYESLKSMTP